MYESKSSTVTRGKEMVISTSMRGKLQKVKGTAIVFAVIVVLTLFVASWRDRVQVANKRIEASWATLSFSFNKRQEHVAEVIQYIQHKAPQEKKLLAALIQGYNQSLEVPLSSQILVDAAVNRVFVSQSLELSQLTQKAAKYSWQKTALKGDKRYNQALKNLYYTTQQLQNAQAILNQDIIFYNRGLGGLSGFVLNALFRYPPKIKLENMIGDWDHSFKNFISEPL